MVANADITIYRKTGRDKETRAELWQGTVWNDVHLHFGTRASYAVGARSAAGAGNATMPQNVCTVRVFTKLAAPCRIGDVLAVGICAQDTPQAARDAGTVCFTICGVFDNRRGSAGMQHWKLEAT